MADTVNYVITIRSESTDEAQNTSRSVARTSGGNDLSPNQENSDARVIGKTAALGYARQALDMYVSTSLNIVEIQTGQSKQAALWEFQYSKAKSYASAAIAGAATGGVGGAIAALVITGAQNLIQNSINMYQLKLEREVDSVGIRMQNIRTGSSGDRALRRY